MCAATDCLCSHPGLTMMALREYHTHAVVHRQHNYSGMLPSWDIFCHTHFWGMMLANRSLDRFSVVTKQPLCHHYIARKQLLLLSGDASFQLGVETILSFLPPSSLTLCMLCRYAHAWQQRGNGNAIDVGVWRHSARGAEQHAWCVDVPSDPHARVGRTDTWPDRHAAHYPSERTQQWAHGAAGSIGGIDFTLLTILA